MSTTVAAQQNGQSPEHEFSQQNGQYPEREFSWRSELHLAAENNDHEKLSRLRNRAEFGELLNAQDENGRTALLIACQKGHVNIVILLLEADANVVIPAKGGFTCLHEAAFAGHDLVVNLLLGGIVIIDSPQLGRKEVVPPKLDHRRKLVEEKTEIDMFTALHLASIQGYKAVIISILESYLDILFQLQEETTYAPRPELHLDEIDRVSWGRFQMQIRPNEVRRIREAAVAAAASNSSSLDLDNAFSNPWASDEEYHKRLVDARLDLLIYVNTQDVLGRTSLHYAAWSNKVDVIIDLVGAGANVNAADLCDFTPLHFASRNGNSRVVSELIRASTDVEQVYLLQGNVVAKSNVSTMDLVHRSARGLPEGDDVRPRISDYVFLEERQGVTPLRYATEGYGNIHIMNAADVDVCQLDYVGMVRMLLEIIKVKDLGLFSPSYDGVSLWTVVFPRQEQHLAMLERNEMQRLFNFGGSGRAWQLGAELLKEAAELAKSSTDLDLFLSIQTQLLWTLEEVLYSRVIDTKLVTSCFGYDNETGLSLFHYAAFAGLGAEMRDLLSIPKMAECVNGCSEDVNQTPLHIAVIEGHEDVVAALVDVEKVRVIEEDHNKRTPLQIAVEKSREEKFNDSWKNIEKLLLKRSEVQRYLDKLYKDRQVYVDAANAILVGAALIASVTFAGWLQPPLGYTAYYDILSSTSTSPAPDESFIAVQQYMSVRAFFVFNSLSFFFAIATVISGAGAVLPAFSFFIKDEVDLVRKWLILTSVLLVFSISFVVGAFAAAGLAVLPPIPEFEAYMIITAAIGVLLCTFILMTFFYRLYLIHPYKWLSDCTRYLRARLPLREYESFSPREPLATTWIDKKYY